MSDLRHRLVIDLAGNLVRRSTELAGASERLANRHGRAMGRMRSATSRMGRALDRWGKRAGLALGAATVVAGKGVADLDERMLQMGVNAKLSGQELRTWRDGAKADIHNAAMAFRTDSGGIVDAMDAIVAKTGDLDFAQQNIANIAAAIRATGAAGSDIGAIMSEFQKMGTTDPGKVMEGLNVIAAQGKEGAFVLKDTARLSERVFAAYGPDNLQAVREMGAVLQFIRRGTGSSDQATTATEQLLSTLRDAKKIAKLHKELGIKVFDEQALKEGREKLRPLKDLMIEIIEAADGRQTLLSGIFDTEAARAFNDLINQRARGVDIRSQVQALVDVQAGATLQTDAAEMGRTMSAALISLKEIVGKIADENLSAGIQNLADTLAAMDPGKVEAFLNMTVKATGGLAAIYIGAKALQGGKWLKDILTPGQGGAAGALGEAFDRSRPMPVYVVNDLPGAGVPGAGKKAGKLAKLGRLGGAASAVGAAGLAGYEVGGAIYETTVAGTEVGDAIGGAIARTLALFGNKEASETLALVGNKEASAAVAINADSKVVDAQEAAAVALQQSAATLSQRLANPRMREAALAEFRAPAPDRSAGAAQAPAVDARVNAIAQLPQAVREQSADMARLPDETARATADAVTGALRARPGRIEVDVTVNDNLTRVRATPTAQPGGFRVSTHNAVEQVAK